MRDLNGKLTPILLATALHLFLFSSFAQVQSSEDPLAKAIKLSRAAVIAFNSSDYERSLELENMAYQIRLEKLGTHDLQTAFSLKNLGYIYMRLQKKKEAIKAFGEAIQIYEGNSPLSSEDELIYADLLETASIYDVLEHDFDLARTRLSQAIKVREKLNGINSDEVAKTTFRLGQTYYAESNYGEALPLLRSAFRIKTAKKDEINSDSRLTFFVLKCALIKSRNADELVELLNKYESKKNSGKDNVDAGIVNGRALRLPRPEVRSGYYGLIPVNILVDESGKVIFACATEGHSVLQVLSEAAAYKAKFSPTIKDGKPVSISGVIRYNFVR